MTRSFVVLAALSLSVVPTLAQDRTLPAGAYRGLNAPQQSYVNPVVDPSSQGLAQGRSEAVGTPTRHHKRVVR